MGVAKAVLAAGAAKTETVAAAVAGVEPFAEFRALGLWYSYNGMLFRNIFNKLLIHTKRQLTK